jgi:hypothetical protein
MTTTSQKVISSSQLLLWPRLRRRRSSEDESGWVLGWKDGNRVVCAGVLPRQKQRTLEDFQTTLKELKKDSLLSSEAKPTKGCTCLLTSLEIVAYYSNGRERTTRQQTSKKLFVPILSLDRGYPWWKKEEGSNDNNNNNHTHKQLLYYPLDEEDKTSFSHFASEYGDTTDWSILLQRLSNAHELLTIVQTGRIPKLLPYQQYTGTNTPSPLETDETSLKEPEEDDLTTATGWNLIQLFVSTQSLTLLHGRQQFSSILSLISWMS